MVYDLDYFEHLLLKCTEHAFKIFKIRWDFVMRVHPKTVLDYGCGVGWFRAIRPKDVHVDSFDIAPVPQTGITLLDYDVTCFWDVLEHIPDVYSIEHIITHSKHIAISIPIKPDSVDWGSWKHFRPREHLHYYTIQLLDAMFEFYNFHRIYLETLECPPREDVVNILYKRD